MVLFRCNNSFTSFIAVFYPFLLTAYDAKLFGVHLVSFVLLGKAGFLQIHGKTINSACFG